MSPSEFVVVIRSASERTVDVCRSLLLRQVPKTSIHVVEERPFEAALRACYRIGIESEAEWMMTVDADVLVRDRAVRELLSAAALLPEPYAQIEGLVHDKLLGAYRQAGHRVYRTKHLGSALKAVPEEGVEIRPEYSTLQRMSRLGYPSAQSDILFGIHDYEQFYRDIYRKAFIHGQKHQHWLSDVFPRWRESGKEDPDFRVALRGFFDGFTTSTNVSLDPGRYAATAEAVLRQLNLVEKPALASGARSELMIEGLQSRVLSGGPPPPPSRYQRAKSAYDRLGTVRLIPLAVGSALCLVGAKLRRIAEADRDR